MNRFSFITSWIKPLYKNYPLTIGNRVRFSKEYLKKQKENGSEHNHGYMRGEIIGNNSDRWNIRWDNLGGHSGMETYEFKDAITHE